MSNPTASASTGPQIGHEWSAWIAENLLNGVQGTDILAVLTQAGVDDGVARQAIYDAAHHPYVQAADAVVRAARQTASAGGSTRALKYGWWLEVMRRSARQASDWGQIPRVSNLSSQELLDQYYAANRPCVIEGAMEGWPALTKWTGEHLRSTYGDQTVQVEVYIDDDPKTSGNLDRRLDEMKFSDFVDVVESGEGVHGHYITANNSDVNMAALGPMWDDVIWPDFLEPGEHPLGKGFLWYGPEGSFTPMHHDLTNNLMAQFRGRKRVKLVAPFESAHVYNHEHRYSKVDLDAIDLERFPAMEDVTIFETVIGPGDMLFIPAGWWHTVRALDVSITITFANFIWDTDHYSHYITNDAID